MGELDAPRAELPPEPSEAHAPGAAPARVAGAARDSRWRCSVPLLIALLAISTTAPLGLLAAGIVLELRDQQVARTLQQNRATARALSLALDRELESLLTTLQLLAISARLDAAQRDPTRLARLAEIRARWHSIWLADSSGDLLFETRTSAAPGNAPLPRLDPPLRAAGAAIFEASSGPAKGDALVRVSIPVQRGDGTVLVLGAMLDTARLHDLLGGRDAPPSSWALLVDRTGRIVARVPSPRAGAGPDLDALGPLEPGPPDSPGALRVLGGTPVYASFHRSSAHGWSIAVATPQASFEQPIRQSLWVLAGASVALLGLGLCGALLLGRTLLQPLRTAAEATQRQAQLLDRSRDELLATVSHELRSPLNAILGWVRLLRVATLDPLARERGLDVIERSTRLQARLIDHLLEMSRLATGTLRLDCQAVDVAALLSSAVDALRATADDREVALALRIRSAPHPRSGGSHRVWGDRDRLHHVFWHLLSNAIKFTPSGGSVAVSLFRSRSRVVVVVRDTGVGIPLDELPRIFERFQQASRSATRAHGGLGIGLSLVERLVDLHGGTVEARSRGTSRGASFRVFLPGIEADAYAEAPRYPEALPAAESELLAGRHVLLVDDDPDVHEIVTTCLRQAGARVTSARSAREALGVLESAPDVDAIISDIGMPGRSGLGFARDVRKTARGEHLLMVALTAFSDTGDRARALRAGFDLHVSKPVEPFDLVRTIAGLSRRR